MQLYISPTSPFVRKTRAFVRERGLQNAVRETPVNPWENDPVYLAINPLRRVPALVLEGGEAILDSSVICEYLDSLAEGPAMIPPAPLERARVKTLEALADGIMESIAAIAMSQKAQSDFNEPEWESWQAQKAERAIQRLAELQTGRRFLHGDQFGLADLAAAVALGYADFRRPQLEWRSRFPGLADWTDELLARPALQETAPAAG